MHRLLAAASNAEIQGGVADELEDAGAYFAPTDLLLQTGHVDDPQAARIDQAKVHADRHHI